MRTIQIGFLLISVTISTIAIFHIWLYGVKASSDLLQLGIGSWFPLILIGAVTEFVNLTRSCFPPPNSKRIQSIKQK